MNILRKFDWLYDKICFAFITEGSINKGSIATNPSPTGPVVAPPIHPLVKDQPADMDRLRTVIYELNRELVQCHIKESRTIKTFQMHLHMYGKHRLNCALVIKSKRLGKSMRRRSTSSKRAKQIVCTCGLSEVLLPTF